MKLLSNFYKEGHGVEKDLMLATYWMMKIFMQLKTEDDRLNCKFRNKISQFLRKCFEILAVEFHSKIFCRNLSNDCGLIAVTIYFNGISVFSLG